VITGYHWALSIVDDGEWCLHWTGTTGSGRYPNAVVPRSLLKIGSLFRALRTSLSSTSRVKCAPATCLSLFLSLSLSLSWEGRNYARYEHCEKTASFGSRRWIVAPSEWMTILLSLIYNVLFASCFLPFSLFATVLTAIMFLNACFLSLPKFVNLYLGR